MSIAKYAEVVEISTQTACKQKQRLRDKIKSDVEKFIEQGGKVDVLDQGDQALPQGAKFYGKYGLAM